MKDLTQGPIVRNILAMAARLLRFWPIGVMALGVSILARRDDAHGRFWGFSWIVVGGWLLLRALVATGVLSPFSVGREQPEV